MPAICVFCGSSFGNNPRCTEAARAIGSGIAKLGFSLVFGGGGAGLGGKRRRGVCEGAHPNTMRVGAPLSRRVPLPSPVHALTTQWMGLSGVLRMVHTG